MALTLALSWLEKEINVITVNNRDLSGVRKVYEDEGYVVIRDVLDADLGREMSQHIDWVMARNPGAGARRCL